MLGNHDGSTSLSDNASNGLDNRLPTLRVEIGGRFVQQDHRGLHGEHPGQRQALLLAPRKMLGGMIKRQVKTDDFEAAPHPWPNLIRVYPQIFCPKGDIVANSRGDHLRIGVLEYQANCAVDKHTALQLPILGISEHTSQRVQERRFSGAGITGEQDDLPRGYLK
ncbi:hypothetical protein GCM10028828_01890 [Corynebacterium tapiri]